MTQAWDEYGGLEASVEQLRAALQARVGHSAAQQVGAGTATPSARLRAGAAA